MKASISPSHFCPGCAKTLLDMDMNVSSTRVPLFKKVSNTCCDRMSCLWTRLFSDTETNSSLSWVQFSSTMRARLAYVSIHVHGLCICFHDKLLDKRNDSIHLLFSDGIIDGYPHSANRPTGDGCECALEAEMNTLSPMTLHRFEPLRFA